MILRRTGKGAAENKISHAARADSNGAATCQVGLAGEASQMSSPIGLRDGTEPLFVSSGVHVLDWNFYCTAVLCATGTGKARVQHNFTTPLLLVPPNRGRGLLLDRVLNLRRRSDEWPALGTRLPGMFKPIASNHVLPHLNPEDANEISEETRGWNKLACGAIVVKGQRE